MILLQIWGRSVKKQFLQMLHSSGWQGIPPWLQLPAGASRWLMNKRLYLGLSDLSQGCRNAIGSFSLGEMFNIRGRLQTPNSWLCYIIGIYWMQRVWTWPQERLQRLSWFLFSVPTWVTANEPSASRPEQLRALYSTAHPFPPLTEFLELSRIKCQVMHSIMTSRLI